MSVGPIEPISRGQFFLITTTSVVVGGVYIWPQTVLTDAGLDAPWAVLLSISVALGITWLQTLWPPKTTGMTELGRMQAVWGWGRWPVFLATAALYVPLDGALVALFSQLLQQLYYRYTPLWFFTITVLLMAGWLASHSLAHIARNIQLWFPLLLASFCLLTLMALGHFHETAALHPASVIRVVPIAKGVVATWYLWMQGEVIVTVGGHVRETTWTQIRHWALAAVALQGAIILIIYALVVGTLGPAVAETLEWPLVYIFSNLTVRTLFISRPSIVIVVAWVVALILYLTLHVFVLTVNLQDGWSLSARGRVGLVWALIGLLGGIAWGLPSPVAATDLVVHWIDPPALGVTIITSLGAPWLVRRRPVRERTPVSPTSGSQLRDSPPS